jgi:hypothetical protein
MLHGSFKVIVALWMVRLGIALIPSCFLEAQWSRKTPLQVSRIYRRCGFAGQGRMPVRYLISRPGSSNTL